MSETDKQTFAFYCWLVGYFQNVSPRELRNNHLKEIHRRLKLLEKQLAWVES